MSPIVKLPIYFYDPKVQKAEIYEFLSTLNVGGIEISEIVPSNIWQVKVDFKYRKEWKLFCCRYWGKDYFEKHINKK